jgi:hypothetical protein
MNIYSKSLSLAQTHDQIETPVDLSITEDRMVISIYFDL